MEGLLSTGPTLSSLFVCRNSCGASGGCILDSCCFVSVGVGSGRDYGCCCAKHSYWLLWMVSIMCMVVVEVGVVVVVVNMMVKWYR